MENFNATQIVKKMGRDPTTIRRFINKYKETGTTENLPRSGRPPALNNDEKESNSETYSIDLTQDINESDDNELMKYESFKKQHKIHHLVVWKVHIAIYYPKFNNEL